MIQHELYLSYLDIEAVHFIRPYIAASIRGEEGEHWHIPRVQEKIEELPLVLTVGEVTDELKKTQAVAW